MISRTAIVLFAAAFFPSLAFAQEPASSSEATIHDACASSEHRQFDFWLGEWTVKNQQGQVAGTNKISRISDGCALLEQWHSSGGNTGNSINIYDSRTGEWTQVWVSPNLILHLRGGIRDGSMVLEGERETQQGPARDRITWTPRADGTVQQHWVVSRDGGATWSTLFDGIYERSDG